MIVIKQHRIYRQDLKANPHILYIFGDNLERKGLGGQAKEMRGETNAFGIATKRRPEHGYEQCYFHDYDDDRWNIIDAEFDNLDKHITNTRPSALCIPSDGIGTGLAKLAEYAPELLKYINKRLLELETFYKVLYEKY